MLHALILKDTGVSSPDITRAIIPDERPVTFRWFRRGAVLADAAGPLGARLNRKINTF